MNSIESNAFILIALGFVSASALANDEGRPLEIDDYFRLQYVSSPQVSPDGKWVAYTVSSQDLQNDSRSTRIWRVSTSGGEAVPMTMKGSSAWRPRWTPDGKHLSFIASAGDGSSQVFTLPMHAGERAQLTGIDGGVEGYEWSPDGQRLVLILRDPEDAQGPGPWVIDRLKFKQDYVGYLDRRRGHLYAYNIADSSVMQITAGDYEDYSPAWSPDGSRIAFVSNRSDEPDSNWNTDIWLVDPDTPHDAQQAKRVTTNPWADSSPIWHPDGERIGYLTTYTDRTDVPGSYLQTKIAIIRPGDDEPVLLTTGKLDRKAYGPVFSPDGRHIYAMLEDNGEVQLVSVAVGDGTLRRLVTGQVRVEAITVAPNGSVITVDSAPTLPSDLFVVDADSAARRRLTGVNDVLLSPTFLSAIEEHRFPTLDGTEIQTFVYKPRDFDADYQYPTILWLHGGQESQYDYGFNFRVQLFAANGYVVVMPNVRGSGGRGQKFTLALNKAYGTADVEDVLVATDFVIDQGYADPDRLGIGGWSSGGTLTNFVIAKTDRFAGAISGASVGWYTTTYGHDPYLRWWNTELGPPWRNRDLWDSISPFMWVENITTPTLFIHGEKDWNQPVIHSEQMYQAMKYLGREASLVVYPDAYHGIRRPIYHHDLLT
ncbi:MAG: S9 family peptidase, partial [Gammaproteobacteria bacterium]|nr:S9 family peptidase [Gammaproteobacteria bacterium]